MARVDSQHRPTDSELVQACREGQLDAFAVLVDRYQDRVFNTMVRMVGSREDARDVVQEALLRAWENLERFRGDAGFYTWLFRIAMNQALSHRRRERRLKVVRAGDDPPGEADLSRSQAAALADSPDGPLLRAERDEAIQQALDGLDGEHRAAVVLRDVEGLDYAAIAAVLDVPVGTVKSRVHRGRMTLRDALRDRLM